MPSVISQKNVIIGTGIVLVLFFVSLPSLLNWAVNTQPVKSRISQEISEKTGTTITASRLFVDFLPQPGIRVDHVTLRLNGSEIQMKQINIDLDLEKLLTGTIDIQNISLVQPEITAVKPIPNRRTSFPAFPSKSEPFAGFPSQLIQAARSLFGSIAQFQETLRFEFTDIKSPYFNNMTGSFQLSKADDQMECRLTIQDIHLDTAVFPGTAFPTQVNIRHIMANQVKCRILFKNNGASIKPPGILNGSCSLNGVLVKTDKDATLFDASTMDLKFNLSEQAGTIEVLPVTFTYPKSELGIIFKTDTPPKKSHLTFTGSDIDVGQAREMSSLLFHRNDIADEIFWIVRGGTIPDISVSFNGKTIETLLDGTGFALNGQLVNGRVNIPETPLTATHVNGSVQINSGVMKISADSGSINGSKIKKGNLNIDLLNYADYPFDGVFDLDVNLAGIPETLISLLPDTLLAQELSMVKGISGKADTTLSLSMPTGTDELMVNVNTDDFSALGEYDRIPGKIRLQNIVFQYDNEQVHVKNATGNMISSSFKDVNASIDVSDIPKINIRSGSGVLDLESVFPFAAGFKKVRDLLSPVAHATGQMEFSSIQVSGSSSQMKTWHYDVKGTAKNLKLDSRKSAREIDNLSGFFHLSNDVFNLQHLHLTAHQIPLLSELTGVSDLHHFALPFTVENSQVDIQKNHLSSTADIRFDSGVQLNIAVEGKGNPANSLFLDSLSICDADLTDVHLKMIPSGNKTLIDFTGRLNTASLKKTLRPESAWHQKIGTVTQDQDIVISSDENLDIHVHSHAVHLDSLSVNRSQPGGSSGYALMPGRHIFFKTDHLKVKAFDFADVDTKVKFRKKGVDIHLQQAFLCGISTSGTISKDEDMVKMGISITSPQAADIPKMLGCLVDKASLMTGSYHLDGRLSAHAESCNINQKINGTLKINGSEGRIYKWTLLSRILSVINISEFFKGKAPDVIQKGFGYNTITVAADVKDSVLHINTAVIDGKDMTLVFQGWIDPLNDKLDITCIVAPFKTVDIIVKHIPIVNMMLGNSLISIPAKATGKLSDPVVVPLHPSAVGKSLINLITNVLKTPVKLLDKLDGH